MRLLSRVLAAVLLATVLLHSVPAEAATRPSAPRSVKATPLNKAVKVTWAAPSSSGTSRINAYAVQRRNTTASPWVTVKYTGATARSWTETGLVNGAPFYYRVMARNGSGWGPASAQVVARPRTVPGAVPELEADNYDAALGAYWKAAAANGATVDRYEVQASLDGVTWGTPVASTTLRTSVNALQLQLPLGKRYWLRARAHNAAGYGPFTGAGPYRVYTKPGAVTGLDATVTSGEVELRWTAPSSNRDAGIPAAAAYRVEVSADGGATWSTDSDEAQSPWTVDGLTNGTAYQFRVSALFSKVGPGPASLVAPGAPIGPPTAPQALTLNWDELASEPVLDWEPPASDGGKPLTRYEVEYWNESVPPPYPVFAVDPEQSEASPSDFAFDRHLRVRACNGPAEADCGPWTEPVGPLTGPVTGLTSSQAMAGTVRTVTVGWTAPANGVATSYDVLRSDDGGTTYVPLATGLTATEYVDSATGASTQYTYKVVPHGGGTGEPRTTSVTTSADQTLSISPTTINVTEGSSTGAQVVLGVVTSQPTDVTVVVSNPALATVVSATVQVAAGESTADVTVTGEQDVDLVGGSTTLTATLGVLQAAATIAVNDNDAQAVLALPASLELANGATQGVDVRLAYQPTSPVTVAIEVVQDGQEIEVDRAQMVFTPANWNVPQVLTITRNSAGTATVDLTAPNVTGASITVTDPVVP